MAIHKQLWLKGSKGKLAGTTFYQTSGVTIQREINYDPSNPRTESQMTQRTKLANLVNMYRAGKSFFAGAFENKKAMESDYNKFVSYNLTDSPVYLTKAQATKGICCPGNYVITQGSLLPSTDGNVQNGIIKMNPFGSEAFSPNDDVKNLYNNLLENGKDVQEGDQVSIVAWKYENSQVMFEKVEIILSSTDETPLTDFFTGWIKFDQDNFLIAGSTSVPAAMASIHSRTQNGVTYVSSETLVSNIATAGTAFTSDAQKKAAIESYGKSKSNFLATK